MSIAKWILPALLIPFYVMAGQIDGQIFIVTQGGNSIKLGLVTVGVLDQKAVDDLISKKQEEAAPLLERIKPLIGAAKADYQKKKFNSELAHKTWIDQHCSREYEGMVDLSNKAENSALTKQLTIEGWGRYLKSAGYYLKGIPNPLQTAKSDADGKFSLEIEPGRYALIAIAERRVPGGEFGSEIERYFWAVKKEVGKKPMQVMLSNDNMTSSGAEESMILADSYGSGEIKNIESGIGEEEKNFKKQKEAEEQEVKVKKEAEEAARRAIQEAEQERKKKIEIEAYRSNPALAQQKAVKLYPDLGIQGSSLNTEFLVRTKRYRTEKPDFFSEPDWPIRLAQEIAQENK